MRVGEIAEQWHVRDLVPDVGHDRSDRERASSRSTGTTTGRRRDRRDPRRRRASSQPTTVWNDAVARRRRARDRRCFATCFPAASSRSRSRSTQSRTLFASSSATSRTQSSSTSSRLRHDRPRRDAPEQAGRRSPAVDLGHEQRGRRRRAEGACASRASAPATPNGSSWGICEYITKPRIEAAITGKTPDGEPIKGDYKFTDEFPMADGFEENVEFFTLTYEAPLRVASQPRVRQDRAAALAARRVAGPADRRHLDGLGRRRRVRRARRPRPDRGVPQGDRRERRRRDRVHRDRRGPAVRVGRRASCPTTSSRCGCTRRTCATSRSRPGGAPGEVHPEGLPGRRRRRRPRQPRARQAASTTATATRSSFSLTATTGAGKTVMAAAAIEALFCGNDDVRLRRRTRARS